MDVDLEILHDLLFEITGFTVNGLSEVLQAARVRSRIRNMGLSSFEEYLKYCKIHRAEEAQQLVNALTVGETYFFRDYDQLRHFAEEVLPVTVSNKNAMEPKNMRLLCAGCSSGEEAYTLSIILREMLEESPSWRICIDAVDINTQQIEKAKRGKYSPRTLRYVPLVYKSRYFDLTDDYFIVSAAIRKGVTFKSINLLNADQMHGYRNYDFIFCRNVLIYLDHNQKEILVHRLYRCLRSGGVLFVAGTESLGRISCSFRYRRIGSGFVYQKD
jgi:chemotaxis protein methyltransferase CheR